METISGAVKNLRIKVKEEEFQVSVSFGCVKADPRKYKNVNEIIDAADQALLDVKKSQRGNFHLIE